MTEIEPKDREETSSQSADGQIEELDQYRPAWTTLLRPVQTFVGLLPSYKNTRKGRRTARQIKIVVAVIAFVAVVAAQPTVAVMLGVVALALVPWVPVSQVQKRSWINRLKSLREPRNRKIALPARIFWTGERVAIERNGELLGERPVDHDARELVVGASDGRIYLRLAGESTQGAGPLWIGTDELTPEDLPEDWPLESFSEDEIERPALVDGSDWQRLANDVR